MDTAYGQPELILPSSPEYETARQIFNRSIQKFPAAILYCRTPQDVACAVLAARRAGRKVRLRTGGHNYEGFCVGDGAVVIDTRRMTKTELDPRRNLVRIGAGVKNAGLYELIGRAGYPFPSGTCPSVAAVGLTLGGGWGLSSRMFGLTCDRLVSAQMVDSEGMLHDTSEDTAPDLFFALRGGGGGNFGVVTELTYALPEKFFDVTYVNISASEITFDVAVALFSRFQDWLYAGDRRFTPISRIFNSEKDGYGFFLRGIYYGTKAQAEASLHPFLTLPGAQATLQEATFLEAIRIVQQGYPLHEKFRNAGRFAPGRLGQEEIRNIVSMIAERAEGSVYASIGLFGLGGRVSDIPPEHTAFFYRDAPYIIDLQMRWEEDWAEPYNLAWLRPRFAYLRQMTRGSYINFPSLLNPDDMRAYYGGNVQRLRRVKQAYDPTNLFCFPQSIR